MAGLFSKNKVNEGRQPELDWLKALCIIDMIFVHIFEDCAAEHDGIAFIFFEVIVIFTGAACFMICMGVGMRYSRKQTPKDYALRGIEILTVGQLLNLVRVTLPTLTLYWIKGDDYLIANSMLVIQADILSFAGLAFLLIALFKKLKINEAWILIIAFIMNCVGPYLSDLIGNTDSFLADIGLGFLIVNRSYCYFPFTGYFVFVAFGYFIGGLYPRIIDKNKLANRILMFGLPACLIYYFLRLFADVLPFETEFGSTVWYYMIPGADAVGECLVALVLLALFYKLTRLMKGKVPKFVNHLSVNINQYYCISYVFTFPVMYILLATRGELLPGALIPLLYGCFVVFACYLIIELNKKYIHFSIAKMTGTKRKVVFAMIWALTIAAVVYAVPLIDTFAERANGYLLP